MDMDEEQEDREPDAVKDERDEGNPGDIEEAREHEEVGEDQMDVEIEMVKETYVIWKKQIRSADQVLLVAQERAPLMPNGTTSTLWPDYKDQYLL